MTRSTESAATLRVPVASRARSRPRRFRHWAGPISAHRLGDYSFDAIVYSTGVPWSTPFSYTLVEFVCALAAPRS